MVNGVRVKEDGKQLESNLVARVYSVLNDGDVGLPPHKCRRHLSKVPIALRLIKVNNRERLPARWKPDESLFSRRVGDYMAVIWARFEL